MRRKRQIPFAFDRNDFSRAVAEVEKSKANRNGKVIDISKGKVEGEAVGIILIEEDVV